MDQLGFISSVLHPSVFIKASCDIFVVVHVDDFLCVGPWHDLGSLCASLKKLYDLKSTMVREGYRRSGATSRT